MKYIKIPEYFYYGVFDAVLDECKALLEEDRQTEKEVMFDLSANKHISVLGLLLIAQFSDTLCDKKGYECFVKTKKNSSQNWFTKIMELIPNSRSQKVNNYLNNFRVEISRCHNDKENLSVINRLIPIIKKELNLSEPVLKALNWALWELVGNAGLHGYNMYGKQNFNYPKPVYFCAFDYKNVIDMAILDLGRGIQRSFVESGNDKYSKISNEEALNLSIQKETSGDPEGSTGFGLFGCAEIARKAKGELVIISGRNKLIVSERDQKILPSSKFDGTMVLLTIPQNAEINLANILGEDSVTMVESLDDLLGDINE